MKKIVGLAIMVIGLVITVISIQFREEDHFIQNQSLESLKEPFIETVRKDLNTLEKSGSLPLQWSSIRTQTIKGTSPQTHRVAGPLLDVIPINPNGKNRLEATLFVEDERNENSRILIQFELYDLVSNNKIWENVRIYEP